MTDTGQLLVIGAGPAGLTAADALVERGERPLVVEADTQMGGIARTVNVRGNRMDIGGHRFLSRSSRVTEWWLSILPLQGASSRLDAVSDADLPLDRSAGAPDPETVDQVMLVRSRLSHILYQGKLFDYPVSLSPSTLAKLGVAKTMRIGLSYLSARLRPIRQEKSLEDFLTNRFGRALYEQFFRDYTEKVWGVACADIDPAWGQQRIRGVSVSEVMRHAWRRLLRGTLMEDVEKSLTGWFYYPKLGPGQLWETLARRVETGGGEIALGTEVTTIEVRDSRVVSVTVRDRATCASRVITQPRTVFSSMPLSDLVHIVTGDVPPGEVIEVAEGLPFRDFITVGILVEREALLRPGGHDLRDTWMYVQEPSVRLGRIQFFNNWSPYLLEDPHKAWLGLEYFAAKGDDLWSLSDEQMAEFAVDELRSIGVIDTGSILGSHVIRVEKAYPAYFNTHSRIDVIRTWADSIENLYVMGRNGMHRYNNMDDSVLSAWAAVAASFGEGTLEAVWSSDAEEGALASDVQ